MFFSFDGIDGSGKSTQMEKFCHWLRAEKKRDVVECREPGGTSLGEKIRDILLNQKQLRLDIEAELFLFMASRSQLVREVIRPALASGKTVVCDRFLLASVVYQGYGGGLDPDFIRHVGSVAIGDTIPDLTFVFHLEPHLAQERLGPSTDRIESRSLEFLQKVNRGFQEEAKRTPARTVAIDGSHSIDELHAQIINAASGLFD